MDCVVFYDRYTKVSRQIVQLIDCVLGPGSAKVSYPKFHEMFISDHNYVFDFKVRINQESGFFVEINLTSHNIKEIEDNINYIVKSILNNYINYCISEGMPKEIKVTLSPDG